MSTITVPLAEEDLTFLRAWTQAQGTSVEAFLARQAHNLRTHLQRPLRDEVTAASGIIDVRIDGSTAHREHLAQKHR